jgi:hypothetical protein
MADSTGSVVRDRQLRYAKPVEGPSAPLKCLATERPSSHAANDVHVGLEVQSGNRIFFMEAGRIIEMATARDFFQSPRSERAKAFLAKVSTP